jgi:hypothetical protein
MGGWRLWTGNHAFDPQYIVRGNRGIRSCQPGKAVSVNVSYLVLCE